MGAKMSLGEFEQLLLLAIVHLGEHAYGVTPARRAAKVDPLVALRAE
jgi:hypothetical protein